MLRSHAMLHLSWRCARCFELPEFYDTHYYDCVQSCLNIHQMAVYTYVHEYIYMYIYIYIHIYIFIYMCVTLFA